MPTLRIDLVETPADRRAFAAFPWRVYKDDPHWVPPLFSERVAFLDPTHNPFFDHATVALFLARRGSEVVGTIAAFTNHRHNEFHQENIGFFGFYEVLEDPEAAAALLAQAEAWARDQGHTAVRGPAQFSTNEECGLLVDGFGDPPRILMTYNPPRYVAYVEANGYQPAMDLWAYVVHREALAGGLPAKLARVIEKLKARSRIQIRRADLAHFEEELQRFKGVYNTGWARNWGFVPMSDTEIDKLAKDLRPLLDPTLIFVAEAAGEPVGFSLTLPDMNEPLRLARPRPGVPEWWTLAKMAWHWKVRRRVSWVRVFALGVLPQYRALGVDALLYYQTGLAALAKGYQHAELSWILANNEMMNRGIRGLGGQIYKTYRFYEKAVDNPKIEDQARSVSTDGRRFLLG